MSVSKCFVHGYTLQELHKNLIGAKGATAFAEMLRKKKSLPRCPIYLQGCYIASETCQLARAMCTNSRLQTRWLWDSLIGIEGATVFCICWNHILVATPPPRRRNIDSDAACLLASVLHKWYTADVEPGGINLESWYTFTCYVGCFIDVFCEEE